MQLLDETAQDRLEDVREMQPTSNSELRARWDMKNGSEVAAYLRDELQREARPGRPLSCAVQDCVHRSPSGGYGRSEFAGLNGWNM